ncbi:MAG: PLP-dependent aminotransferase family protein [Rhodospirillales bacterium]|nr:PLP-dependent aminotransferase family protein [Rhodospirillales bacterium]
MFLPDQNRQLAVFDRLRRAILAGSLQAGARLPPSRRLAEELSVSRQTVVLAYERLAAEGYVRARIGSGTFVAADLPDAAPPTAAPPPGAAQSLSRRGAMLAAIPAQASAGPPLAGAMLAPGVPAFDLFPARDWARSASRVLRTLGAGLTGYPPPQGLAVLRTAIAAHLAATRGLAADPEAIVITGGTQQALGMAASLLLDPGDRAWVENPGYIAGRGALAAAGAQTIGVPSDAEGMDIAAGIAAAADARLVLVAPSHATPLGAALALNRRLALLDWAGRAGVWVLEDDCDSEFRWEGHPLPPLATLDRAGRVIYCGSFSKTLAPALRLGFLVAPPPLVPAFVRLHTLLDRGTDALAQATLADFMGAGLLAPHIRRMRTEYAARRAALLAAFARHAPMLTPVAAPGGLHLTLRLPAGADEAAIVAACRARGLGVQPLAAYYLGPARMPGLVAGFAGTPEALAADCARRLASAVAAAGDGGNR